MDKNRVFQMRATDSFLEAIDDWRRQQKDIPARAEAIRRLVEAGLRLDGVYAHMGDLERALIEWATRAGASEREMGDLKRWIAMGRRLTEPLGPEKSGHALRLDISKEEVAEALSRIHDRRPSQRIDKK